MIYWRLFGIVMLLVAFIPQEISAQSYDAHLRIIAAKLSSKLEQAGQRSVTVLDFTDLQNSPTELGRYLAQEITEAMVNSGARLQLIDRTGLQYLLKEHNMSIDGFISPETSRKLGRLIGVDTIVRGTIVLLDQQIRLSLRAVSVETGQIIAGESIVLIPPNAVSGLATHRVSEEPPGAGAGRGGLRDRLRANSIKMAGSSISKGEMWPAANFSLENLSGIGLGIALESQGIAVGPCNSVGGVSGLRALRQSEMENLRQDPNPAERLKWMPPGARVSATVIMQCQFPVFGQFKTVPMTVNVVLASGKEVISVPISTELPVIATEPNSRCGPGYYQDGAFCFPKGGAIQFR